MQTHNQYPDWCLPPAGTDPERILDFRNKLINKNSAYRNDELARVARNYWFVLGRQWIRRHYGVYFDSNRGFVYRDIERGENARLPMPVTNYCSPAVEVEMAAQTKRQWTPSVMPDSDDPSIVAAAKEAKEWLTASLEDERWGMARDRFTHQSIVSGTGILWSYWDENYNELCLIAPGTQVKCASCGGMLHSQNIHSSILGEYEAQSGPPVGRETYAPTPGGPVEDPLLKMPGCPSCGGSLNSFEMHPDQASEKDMFGRELGVLAPKGYPKYELVSCNEFFPENGGIDITPENIRRMGIRKARSMDWIEEHYPDRIGEIEPQAPAELMSQHPILGEWDYLGDYAYHFDKGIYDNHAWVDTIVDYPSFRHPKGRLVVMCRDVLLEDGDLVRVATDDEGNEAKILKQQVFCARYKERPNIFWGEALIDQIVSPQRRLNAGDSLDFDTMARLGAPNMAVPEDVELTGPEYNQAYGSAKIMRYSASAMFPAWKGLAESLFGHQFFHDKWAPMREALVEDIKQLVGPQDVEIGEAPRNIGTTSGLQVLGEQAERRRAARERAIVDACERAWTHRLQLLWCFSGDFDSYSYYSQGNDQTWERKEYNRLKIKGQTKVRIEKSAFIDKSLYQREGAREAQADMLYDITTPQAKKRLLEIRGLPTDVNEDQNRQIDHALHQWSDFIREQLIPVPDPTLDDPMIHYQVLGMCIYRNETKELEAKIGWPAMLKQLAGWPEQLLQLKTMEQASYATYGARIPPEAQAEAYAMAKVDYGKQEAQYAQMQQAAGQVAEAGGAPPMLPEAPMPPRPPFFLPPAKEEQVLMVWQQMLLKPDPMTGMTPQLPPEAALYLQFRAVYEAYRLYAEDKAFGIMPGLPAPGAGPAPMPPGAGGPPGGPTEPQAPATPPDVKVG